VQLDATNLHDLARGCAVLGTGGGGDPDTGLLMSLQAVEQHGPVTVVDLDELPDDGLVMPCGGLGAPTVSIEKFGNGGEGARLRERVERLWGRPVVALMPAEIGGSNGLVPVAWAGLLGLPVVDADGMGRAFPEMQQVTMEIAGISPNPAVMTDERGNTLVIETIGGRWIERVMRAVAVEFGARASSSEYQLTVAQARTATVRGSVSLALRIGELIRTATGDRVAALLAELRGHRLLDGKVVDVERRTVGGFARGTATIEGTGGDGGRTLVLEIQNENLVAREEGRVVASVPDLITVIDSESANTVTTERLRYGQRVSAIAFPCDPIWRTAGGIALAGPRAFGYDFDYVPVERLHAGA
jgi:uncharacterized protein